MKNIVKFVIVLLLTYLLFYKRDDIVYCVLSSIQLFNNSLFPSIFPIMILSDFILSTNTIYLLSNYLGGIFSKAFKLSKISIYPFIMSMISGSPSNAKYISDLLNNNYISKNEAIKLLCICINYNPLLIISLTSYLNFKDRLLLLMLNIFCNILVGILFRNVKVDICYFNYVPKKFSLINSISNSINVLLNILGIVTFFNILNSMFSFNHPLLIGILEITNGFGLLKVFNISYNRKFIYSALLISFSGLSILTQIKSILGDTLNYSLFYKSRIIHLLLYLFFSYIVVLAGILLI